MKSKATSSFKIAKEDFIKFLASATPDEVNQYIMEKGKPRKLIEPIIYFDKKDSNNKRDE